MLLPFLIYSSIFSLCLGQFKLEKSTYDDQACYIPTSCKTGGTEKKLLLLSDTDTVDANACPFWFTLNPYSMTKALIRISSKENLEVNFNDGESFFSCKYENGNVTTGSGPNYENEKTKTYKDGDRLNCEILMKRVKNAPNPGTMIPQLQGSSVLKMKATYNNIPYTYVQNEMNTDYGKKVRCDPDKISPLPDNYKDNDYHYTDANTEYEIVTCPSNYKLMFVSGPKGTGGKPDELTSLKCIEEPSDKYKYEKVPKGKGIDSGESFHLSCRTTDRLCKMCTDPGTIKFPCTGDCPKYKDGIKDAECNTFECPKFLVTKSGTVKKGAQCTPSDPPGSFEWKVVKHGTNITKDIERTECRSEVDCKELSPLEADPTCDPIGCPDSTTPTCSADYVMTFFDGNKSEKVDSITCDRSSGDWKSNEKIIAPGSTYNCTHKRSNSGDDGKEGNASLRTGGSSDDIDWLLIGCIAGGGLLILIIGAIVVYVMLFRPEKKPASVAVPSAPPTAPTSQPPSTDKTSSLKQPPSSGSTPTSQPMTPPVVSLPREPVKVVLVVKHEEVKKEKSKMETINIKQNIPDEKTEGANSQTGENISNRTGDNSKAETKEQSKTAGTTREKTNTQSEVQKKSEVSKGEVNHTKTEEDSKSFIDAYNKELDKKLAKKK